MSLTQHNMGLTQHNMGLTQHNMSSIQHNMSSIQPNMSPKYLFLAILSHGHIGSAAEPFKSNEHASTSLKHFISVPNLNMFINCSPGSILYGHDNDNAVLMNYFKNNSSTNLTDFTQVQTQTQTQTQIISSNFLKHVTAGIKKLDMPPRERTNIFRSQNKRDIDVCRNSFICDGQVGVTHSFVNKTFSNNLPLREPWGIYIYNNNIPGIIPGKLLTSIKGMPSYIINDSNGKPIIIEVDLKDIIFFLTTKYNLTDNDYLFFFDYTCNNFIIDPQINPRMIRRLGRDFGRIFNFRHATTQKKLRAHRTARSLTKGGKKYHKNKRTKKHSKNHNYT